MKAPGAFVLIVVIIAVTIGWLFFAGYIIQLNVNDIASYLQEDKPAPFWPFLWIMLIAALTIGGGSKVTN